MSYRIYFCLLIAAAVNTVAGQPAEPALTQLVHTVWGVEEGLPQSSVYDVLQTRDGYLWLGTQEGLVRFDGVTFKVFDRSALDGLASNEIRALLETRDGALWIGTNGGGVSRLVDGVATTFDSEDRLASNLVRALYQDAAGTVWIGTIDGGLARFDGGAFTHYGPEQGLPGNVVLAVQEDAEGRLYVGTEGGLARFERGRFMNAAPDEPLARQLIWALHADRDGSVWAGTDGGLLHLRGDAVTTYTAADGLCGNAVAAIHRDPTGTLWVGTLDGGVCRLLDGRFERFSTAQGLSNDRVRAITHDVEGNLWVGTEGGGLNQLRRGKFTPITRAEGLSGDVVFAVLEDRNGAVWVGTESGGLTRFRDGHATHFTTTDGLATNDVYALHEDRLGRLWAGLFGGGLCRLDGSRFVCLSEDDGLNSPNVYAIAEDVAGTLWIGTEVGVNLLRDGKIESVDFDDELRDAPITAILPESDGTVWVGTYGAGLHAVDGDRITRITSAVGLTSDIVLALHRDAAGAMWIGTQGGGLCRLQDDDLACATTREGLFNDNVLQILEDDADRLWFGSNRGIFRISKTHFEDVVAGRSERLEPIVYGKADGLENAEASGGTQPAAYRSRDGRLWFATVEGVAWIDPSNEHRNGVPPPVVIESATAGERILAAPQRFELAPEDRDVAFAYTALTFAAGSDARFRYRLEGYDDHWIDAGDRREAFYTALPPGDYVFRVQAANADGTWNESGAAVGFVVQPWFYETTWFLVLCVALLVATAIGVHGLRIRQLKERERELERVVDERTHDLRLEKEKTEQAKAVIEEQAEQLKELDRFKTRFFANVSHEFRTPLTMIVGPLENALSGGYGVLPDRMRQQVEIMLRNALRLLRLINQLLDISKLEAGKMELRASARNVVAFLDGVVLSCTAFAERKEIDLQFNAGASDVQLFFEPDKLEKVFFNLLSNAVKFTPKGGSVAVSVDEQEETEEMPNGAVVVRVADTGRGIPADQLEHVFDRFHQVDESNSREFEGSGIGLSLVKELVLLHRGTIAVESELGRGTTFVVTLPRGRAHLDDAEVSDDVESVETHHQSMTELASSAFDYMHADERVDQRSHRSEPAFDAPLVLVVDDNKDVREYVAGILEDTYRIATAGDGEEGLALAHDLRPDCIISDVMMPRMDGNEFCRRVRESTDLAHIPFILVTARATHDTLIEGLEGGADDYLAKPFNADELRVRVRNLLALRRQEKELKQMNEGLEAQVREQVDVILEQRRRYEAELIDARDRAEAADRLKSSILDNMNHELRTPLTAILGYSSILKKEAPEELAEFAAEITANSRRLMTTLDALLELSRLEAEAGESSAEETDLVELARRGVRSIEQAARARHLSVRFVIDPSVRARFASGDGSPRMEDVALPVHTNRAAIQQALRHVLDNAVKFTSSGGITVTVGEEHGTAFVRVEDTGVGIRPEFLPHVFDAFSQESNGLTRTHEGVGLGLTVARRLVEIVGGRIDVASGREGSTFTIALGVV